MTFSSADFLTFKAEFYKNIVSHTPELVISCIHTTSDFITMCHQWLAVRSLVAVPTTGCLVTFVNEIHGCDSILYWTCLRELTIEINGITSHDRFPTVNRCPVLFLTYFKCLHFWHEEQIDLQRHPVYRQTKAVTA